MPLMGDENMIENNDYEVILQKMPLGYACFDIVYKRNKIVDFIFSNVNDKFYELTGLDSILGKKLTKVVPNIKKDSIKWIELFQDVVLNDESLTLDRYSESLDKHFNITGFKLDDGRLVILLRDISLRQELKNIPNENMNKLTEANRKLFMDAISDNVTGLYNKYFVYEVLKSEMERSRRSFESLSLGVVKIDGFENIMELYADDVIQKVIERIGYVINETLRKMDYPSRFYADEFVIVFPNTRAKHAMLAADRIRVNIKEYGFSDIYNDLYVTISIGIKEYDGGSVEEFIEEALDKLNVSVEQGGDMVTW
jgi:diguanylate cyclase (GGDEF)-like protein